MGVGPLLTRYLYILDLLPKEPGGPNRNSQPLQTVGSFDPVPISPIIFCVLGFVINNELIDAPDDVEIALPWNVV